MKHLLVPLLLLLIVASGPAAEASWLVDIEKFSVSVHREMGCTDCHANIAGETLHPDPRLVGRQLTDFFSADSCLNCHDSIQDNLQQGMHGSRRVDDPQKYGRCIQCHNPHYQRRIGQESTPASAVDMVSFSDEDRACLECHGLEADADSQAITAFCFHCHARAGTRAQEITAGIIPLIDPGAYQSVPHAEVACLVCHPRAAAFDHAQQTAGDCLHCHVRHDESVAHDAHLLVSCPACHLKDVSAVRDPGSVTLRWRTDRRPGATLDIHAMPDQDDPALCRRCHRSGNQVGAAAAVLPPKSLLCMPCHAATFSAGDIVSILSLAVFAAGLLLMFSVILSGSVANRPQGGLLQKISGLSAAAAKTLLSPKIGVVLRSLAMDVLLQRRLYRQSVGRWLIHSLIFLSFLFRFGWGVFALLASLWAPQWSIVWFMLDKNRPGTAFLFDLSGVLILAGVILAFFRGHRRRAASPVSLPGQDRAALSLIGAVVVIGFFLEGMRIAMTGWPPGSGYAFVGYGISLLFLTTSGLPAIYGYIWYLHAIATGLFIAYLPFSRLIHMIIAPVTLAMRALTESEHAKHS